jgi:lysozyme family protein
MGGAEPAQSGYSVNFDEAFDTLLGHEGAYSNHPSDPGSETMWGVTRKVAIQEGYTGDMHVLPRELAKTIYRKRYWSAVQADKLHECIRYTVFDAAVNSGPKQAIKWLQRVLCVEEDGVLGPVTFAAMDDVPPLLVGTLFNAERLSFMTDLPTWGHFGRGWARRIAENLRGLIK